MRGIAGLGLLLMLAGCNGELSPPTEEDLSAHLKPGRSVVVCKPPDEIVVAGVPPGYGIEGTDREILSPGTRCRVTLDLGGSRERPVAVEILEGELEGVSATIPRKNIRPID